MMGYTPLGGKESVHVDSGKVEVESYNLDIKDERVPTSARSHRKGQILREKLQLDGLNENEDPYELWKCGRFEDDMTRWPTIEYGHIFVILLSALEFLLNKS